MEETPTVAQARASLNEGNAKARLAESGVEPINSLKEAIALYQRAREGLIKNTPDYASCLTNEGTARQKLADLGVEPVENLREAIVFHSRARVEGHKENTSSYAIDLMSEGNARLRLARLGVDSENNLKGAIVLYDRARNEGLTKNTTYYANTFTNEGLALLSLAEIGVESVDNAQKAIVLCEKARNEGLISKTQFYATSLINEGVARRILAALGVEPVENLREAIVLYGRAREEGLIKNTPDYAKTLGNEGITKVDLARLGVDSEENLKEAITLYCRARSEGFTENTTDYAKTFMNEGTARLSLARMGVKSAINLHKAESNYLNAKNFFTKTKDILNLFRVNNNLGDLKYYINEMKDAYDYLKEAIQLVEKVRVSIRIPELRRDYFETVVSTYKNMVFTCLALGKVEEAFITAELAKGRIFLERIASEKRGIKGDPELVKTYEENQKKIQEIEMKFINKRMPPDADVELRRRKRTHYKLLTSIKQSDPEYYSIRTVEPINLYKLKKILKGRTLVEYFLGSKLAIFVMNGNLIVRIVEINEELIREKMLELRRLIYEMSDLSKQEELLSYFYDVLIKPVIEYLGEEIIIVPHGILHLLPFQALKSKRYLIEGYKMSFAQSASSLRFLKKGKGKGVLIVGNPTGDLEFSEEEAIKIAELLQVNPLLGKEAKKKKIIKAINGKNTVHFACHGKFDSVNPAFSGIILSDGILTAIDFMNMELDAELIVLSACETALSGITSGDEIEGLVRTIHYGGCRYVIASLWNVDDRSTLKLFLRFYREKGDLVDRLKEAALKLKDDKYSLYHWAPFQVYGA